MSITCTAGGVVTPSSLTFLPAPSAILSLPFSFTAPPAVPTGGGTVTCSFSLSGIDVAHWIAPPPWVITIVPQSSFVLSGWPSSIAYGQQTPILTFTPQSAPFLRGVD